MPNIEGLSLLYGYCVNVFQCDVVILGPPSKPIGPLEVSEVTANSAKLSWQKPLDDGGDEILNYVLEKLNTKTGDWEKVGVMSYMVIFILYTFKL